MVSSWRVSTVLQDRVAAKTSSIVRSGTSAHRKGMSTLSELSPRYMSSSRYRLFFSRETARYSNTAVSWQTAWTSVHQSCFLVTYPIYRHFLLDLTCLFSHLCGKGCLWLLLR